MTLFLEVMQHYGNDVKHEDIEQMAIEEVLSAQGRGEYPYTDHDSSAIEREISSGRWTKLDTPEIGCAVAMALDSFHPDKVQHLGVYIGENKFIHILEDIGVLTTRIDDRFFRRKIKGFYRWNP